MIELKYCPVCSKEKPITNFALRKDGGKTRRRYLCNSCKYEKYGDWKKKNPEKAKLIARKVNLKRNWGLTPEQYDAMVRAQDGVCSICKNSCDRRCHRTGDLYPLVVDHDHTTGKIRGLLCNRCNRALGLLRDDMNVLSACITYLKKAQ